MHVENTIGNTPLVQLQYLASPHAQVWAKLEGNNPAGSVKDRPAYSMIIEAEKRGDIKPGDRLIEATSGNTGIALAMVAAMRGYKMTLIMPENQSVERRLAMTAYGAELILVPKEQGMEGARDLAQLMMAREEGFVLDQFANPDNPLAHYRGTAPEIWRDSNGKITHFVSSMGTTGTITGCSQFFKEKNPNIKIIGVQPEEGAQIAGIRKWADAYLPKIYTSAKVDDIRLVKQNEAETTMRILAKREGIFAGVSSGGAMAIALKIAEENPSALVVSIVCDRGDRYLSTGLFNE